MRHLLALGLLLASGDWAIISSSGPPICAKDQAVCQQAIEAIRQGLLWPDLVGEALECRPLPGCFRPESNCIKGFNC